MPNTIRTIKEEVRVLGTRKRPLTYGQMTDIIKERHPDANTSVKTVQWYASRLRRDGEDVNVRDGRTALARSRKPAQPSHTKH
ncbi:hypothetical protein P9A47_gp57 [Xanthomonas phage Elanor]|uniref:Uncharacterized protein n=1 Tax=Xanthomonas phage Elanor TaxID=2939127 RepID=A0A9E7E1A1_9CAUD|nr:hypothetical protein P9A47_gp57 [Xanthomonas phage Elanor]URA07025.1 hypothetical protein Elanor_BL40057 [Xanthomonas phage Elanor]